MPWSFCRRPFLANLLQFSNQENQEMKQVYVHQNTNLLGIENLDAVYVVEDEHFIVVKAKHRHDSLCLSLKDL